MPAGKKSTIIVSLEVSTKPDNKTRALSLLAPWTVALLWLRPRLWQRRVEEEEEEEEEEEGRRYGN